MAFGSKPPEDQTLEADSKENASQPVIAPPTPVFREPALMSSPEKFASENKTEPANDKSKKKEKPVKEKKEKPAKAPKPTKSPKAPKEKKTKEQKLAEKNAPKKATKVKAGGFKKGGKEKAFVLLIGDEGAILVFMEGPKVVRRLFAMSPKPSHTEAILKLLQTNPKVPITILVDNIDQQYVRQSFPPVSSLSVKNLVQRRIDRDFQAEDLNGYLPVGRDKIGRKEWHFLLISLAKTEILSEWIDLIIELPTPFKGIYLAPVEATEYIPNLFNAVGTNSTSEWQLLLTHNKISGYRQVVLHNGKIVFTRVAQATDDAIPAVIAGNIEQEIISTLEYLKRLEFDEDAGLDMITITSSEVCESLDLKRFNLGETKKLSPLDVANALNLEQAALSADRFGDVVMACAFIRAKKHVLKFTTVYAKALDKLYSAKKGVKIAGSLMIVALVGLSVQNVLTVVENKSLTNTSIEKRQALGAELSSLQKKVEGLDKNLAFKSAVVAMYDTYIKKETQPLAFAAALMPHLTPEERLVSLEWTLNSAAKSTNGAAVTTSDKNALVTIKAEFELKGNYPDMDAVAKASTAFVQDMIRAMPEYTVTNDPFSWEKEKSKGLEISFDPQREGTARTGNERVIIYFNGPKKVEPKPADAAAPSPVHAGAMP